ncbi:MAG: anti-sigma factor [Deinococcota bacterium]
MADPNNINLDDMKLLDYVTGGLTPQEERELAAYLQAHPDKAAEARDLFELMAEVALTEEPEPVSADAEASLLTRIRTQDTVPSKNAPASPYVTLPAPVPPQPARSQRAQWWLTLAAAAVLAFAIYVVERPTEPTIDSQLATECALDTVSCERLVDAESNEFATLATRADNSLYIVFDNEPPDGNVYQAWEIADGVPQSLGVWASRDFDSQTALAEDSVFGVSLEPPGGSPQPTTTPIVVVPLG